MDDSDIEVGDWVKVKASEYIDKPSLKDHFTPGKAYQVRGIEYSSGDPVFVMDGCRTGDERCEWFAYRFEKAEIELTEEELKSAVGMPNDLEDFAKRYQT